MYHKRRFNNRRGRWEGREERRGNDIGALLQETEPFHCRLPENGEQGIFLKEALQEEDIEGNMGFRK